MKKTILIFLLFISIYSQAQVGINPTGAEPHPSAMLDVSSTSKGLLLPRTTNPATNIATPAAGLMIYNTTTNTPNYYNGSSWQSVTPNPQNMGFRNIISFKNGDASTWTVPAGITKIMIEGWGKGADGTVYIYNNGVLSGSGGGAGGYNMNLVDVTPGEILTINFNFSATFVKNSTLDNLIIAYDGRRADSFNSGIFIAKSGENGHQLELSYGNQNATSYNLIVKLGDGGDAYNGGKGGKGQTFVSQNSQTLLYTTAPNGMDGGFPGGGGGAGYTAGGAGGGAFISIYY
jgi:hypothetical protein